MSNTFDILQKNREYMLQLIENYSFEQLNSIPENFSNSVIWNFGHMLVTEKILTYGLCNVEIPMVSAQLIERFRKGTHPELYSEATWQEIKNLFLPSLLKTKEDYHLNRFQHFKPYTTSIGVYLDDINTTLQYILYHEGIHAGVIQSIRKHFT